MRVNTALEISLMLQLNLGLDTLSKFFSRLQISNFDVCGHVQHNEKIINFVKIRSKYCTTALYVEE